MLPTALVAEDSTFCLAVLRYSFLTAVVFRDVGGWLAEHHRQLQKAMDEATEGHSQIELALVQAKAAAAAVATEASECGTAFPLPSTAFHCLSLTFHCIFTAFLGLSNDSRLDTSNSLQVRERDAAFPCTPATILPTTDAFPCAPAAILPTTDAFPCAPATILPTTDAFPSAADAQGRLRDSELSTARERSDLERGQLEAEMRKDRPTMLPCFDVLEFLRPPAILGGLIEYLGSFSGAGLAAEQMADTARRAGKFEELAEQLREQLTTSRHKELQIGAECEGHCLTVVLPPPSFSKTVPSPCGVLPQVRAAPAAAGWRVRTPPGEPCRDSASRVAFICHPDPQTGTPAHPKHPGWYVDLGLLGERTRLGDPPHRDAAPGCYTQP